MIKNFIRGYARLQKESLGHWEQTLAIRRLRKLGEKSRHLCLDLGSGGPGRPGTVGIDMHPNADLVWDLTRGIPTPSNTVNAIYSDHFLEHLPLLDIVKVLNECHRVLIDGGRLRFTVPHINPYVDAWIEGNDSFIHSMINDVPQDQTELYATPFDRISWMLLRNGEHKSMFDHDSILHKVRLAGFQNVRSDVFREHLDRNRRFSSIYVDALK